MVSTRLRLENEADVQDSAHGIENHFEHRFRSQTRPNHVCNRLEQFNDTEPSIRVRSAHLGRGDVGDLSLATGLPLRGSVCRASHISAMPKDAGIADALMTNTGVCPDMVGKAERGWGGRDERDKDAFLNGRKSSSNREGCADVSKSLFLLRGQQHERSPSNDIYRSRTNASHHSLGLSTDHSRC